MANDYYADAAPPPEAATPPEAPEEQESAEAPETEQEGESAVAEIPRTILGGQDFKPGDQVTLEVVQMNENSVLVKYASEESAEPAREASSPAEPAGGPMSAMME